MSQAKILFQEVYKKMLKSKFFLKKTRSGSIVKITREHYLRDDVWCGCEECSRCKQDSPLLTLQIESLSILNTNPHFIVLDTNVVLHQVCINRKYAQSHQ